MELQEGGLSIMRKRDAATLLSHRCAKLLWPNVTKEWNYKVAKLQMFEGVDAHRMRSYGGEAA